MRHSLGNRFLAGIAIAVAVVGNSVDALAADTDADGLDDAWETLHFGNLSRTASGDFETDGMTELEEYTHGMVPTVSDAFADHDGDRYPSIFELRNSASPSNASSTPTANFTVDQGGGGTHTNISAAVTAANAANGAYQIVAIRPGTYVGTTNLNLSIASTKPRLLFIGTSGAASTIIDGGGTNAGWSFNIGGVVASLTFRRTTRALYLNAVSHELRVYDSIFRDNIGSATNQGVLTVVSNSRVHFVGCTLLNNTSATGTTHQIHQSTGTFTLLNTVIWGSAPGAMLYTQPTSVVRTTSYSLVKDMTLSGTGNLPGTTDPLLREDGRVRETSPLLAGGSGTTGSPSGLDIDLETRPAGARSIGADQWIDTDGDQLADAWEVQQTSGLVALTGVAQDSDSDGLGNSEEYRRGTGAVVPDTDGDGALDGAEVAANSNPLDSDTDDDGMPDGYELAQALNPLVDDAFDDQDRDRFPNVFEWAKGSNPSSAASLPTIDRVVNAATGNNSTTDNIYDDLQDAVAAAVAAGGEYAIIGIDPGTYVGTRNRGFSLTSAHPRLLVIGLAGAGATVIDGEGQTGSFYIQRRSVIASLTIRNLNTASPININTLSSSGSRLVDLILSGHNATNLLGVVTIQSAKGVVVAGCTVIGNKSTATGARAFSMSSSSELTVRSSIIWNPTLVSELTKDAPSIAVANNSLIRGNVISGTNNVVPATDPLLRPDGRIRSASPARNVGAGPQSGLDMDLEARPVSGADIGADQWLDVDLDGLADTWEVQETGSLVVLASAAGDADGDGLSNTGEYENGTDPTVADTDGDGASDAAEVTAGTNPLDSDSDDDGMNDGWELANAFNPLLDDAFGDADGDRFPNVFEAAKSTNPRSAASVPTPDRILNALTGNNSTTDNIYDDLQDAVAAAVAAGTNFAIIGVDPGVYVGTRNRGFSLTSAQPTLLVIGLQGAARTIFDGELSSGQFNFQRRAALASLTIRNFSGSSDIILFNGASASGSRLVDLVVTGNQGATLQGVVGAYYGATGIEVVGSSIFANTSANASARALYLNGTVQVTVRSSILWNPGLPSELYKDAPSTVAAHASLVRGNVISGSGNVVPATDPLLRSDGRSRSGSPARGAGAIAMSSFDMDLEARPSSGTDIGADEFVDVDGDTLADAWEIATTGGTVVLTSAAADHDGDGVSNEAEFNAGTHPTDADSDDDGLTDGQEVIAGTNPLDSDADDDGIPDGYEVNNGLNPLVDDSYADADGDRYPNIFEYAKGTNPNLASSFPAPDRIVNVATGNNSTTDNIYDDLQDAVAAAVAGGGYAVIGMTPGTYTGTRNVGFTVSALQTRLLVIGLNGAANTIIDGGLTNNQFNIQNRSVLASLTIRGLSSTSPISFNGAGASGARLVDVVLTGHNATTLNGVVHVYNQAKNVEVLGCTIFGNLSSGASSRSIYVASNAGVTFRSTIVWNPGVPNELYKDATSTTLAHSSLVRNDAITGTGNVVPATDPLLRPDGRSRAGSPARGTGAITMSLVDMDLEPRPVSGTDIGADEFVDGDGDTLADAWEVATAGSTAILSSAAADHDGDGVTNGAEFNAATNPTVVDTDGDGLNDGQEVVAGTDPLDTDSDDDGIPDGYEVSQGLNPLVDDSYADADGDRYPNIFEYTKGTNPNLISSFPAPDRIVNAATGNNSTTDNIYDDLQDAVAAAVVGSGYAIIGVTPGTYTGARNSGFTVAGPQTRLLVIGLGGAANTILDGGLTNNQFNIQNRSVLASLTIRRLTSTSPISFNGAGASGSRLVDVILTGHSATTLNGVVHVFNQAKNVEVLGSTIFGNSASGASSRSIYVSSNSGVTLRSTIVWNPGVPNEIYKDATSTAQAHFSLVRNDAITGTDNVTPATDPLLDAAGRPQLGSPVIKQGAYVQSRFDMDLDLRSLTDPDIGADHTFTAPTIASNPALEAYIGQPWSYLLTVTHPTPGELLTLTVEEGPVGMVVLGPDEVEWVPTGADIGDHTVRLRVTDESGDFDEQLFTLAVYDGDLENNAPFIVSTAPTTAQVSIAYQHSPVVVDPDFGDVVSLSLVAGPTGMSISNGAITWTPTLSQWGAHSVVFRATDQGGLYDQRAFSIIVGGRAPSFQSTPVTAAVHGTPYTYAAVATDPDAGDTVRYALLAGPVGMQVNGATGVVTWEVDQDGVHPVQIVAHDSTGLAAFQSFAVTVSANSSAPAFSSSAPDRAAVNLPYSYQTVASDADGDAVSFSLLASPAGMSVGPSSGLVVWTPALGQIGSHTVVLQAADGRGLSTTQVFEVEVTPQLGPRVAIGLAHSRNVARLEDGASIVGASAELAGYPASSILSDNATDQWRQPNFPTVPHSVTVALAGGLTSIDRIVVGLDPAPNSTTGLRYSPR
ncbi:MAG: hypothetical protein IPG45_16200 [Deltaproteobacteria bacterium]|nr:hypothetical protein [Deltaproteobacteria bacterium]